MGKLLQAVNARTGERLSKATVLSILRDLRAFFLWLGREPSYRSKIAFANADHFNLPDKDVAIARARREPDQPTVEQMRSVLDSMPATTPLERRDRALVALTGARAAALASFRLRHINAVECFVDQDVRVVRTSSPKRSGPTFIGSCLARSKFSAPGAPSLNATTRGGPMTRFSRNPKWPFTPTAALRRSASRERAGPQGRRSAPFSGELSKRPGFRFQPTLSAVDAGPTLHGGGPLACASQSCFAEPRPFRPAVGTNIFIRKYVL
jgi:integrase